jgi:hypothetical protein
MLCLYCEKPTPGHYFFCNITCRQAYKLLDDLIYLNTLKEKLIRYQKLIKEFQNNVEYENRIRMALYHHLVNVSDRMAVEIIRLRGQLGIE